MHSPFSPLAALYSNNRKDKITDAQRDKMELSVEPLEPRLYLSGVAIGEVGSITFSTANRNDWETVTLTDSYVNPVVIAQPASYNATAPTTIRVRNVLADSFEIQLDEWDYLNGIHQEETVSYVVMEAGTHVLTGGATVHVGTAEVNHNYSTVVLPTSMARTPTVLTQTQTVVGGAAITTRQKDVTNTQFDVKLQEEQGADGTHSFETVGYIAMTPGTTQANGTFLEVGLTDTSFNSTFNELIFTEEFEQAPIFVANMQSETGVDPATLRYQNLTGEKVEILVQEEQSVDGEMNHSHESIGFMAFSEAGQIMAQPTMAVGETGTIDIRQTNGDQWHTVTFNGTYVDPVVIAQPPSYNGTNPSTVRIRNVTTTDFEIQLDEWNYLDGGHGTETIGYAVMEKGTYVFNGGIVIEAGTTSTNHKFSKVDLAPVFSRTPTILTQAQTRNGMAAVVTRQRNATATDFEVKVQEEEANDGQHGQETIGYFAISTGRAVSNGFSLEAGILPSFDSTFQEVTFQTDFESIPIFLASMQTNNDNDPASLRFRVRVGPETESLELLIEEEQSQDQEKDHGLENIGFIAFGAPGMLMAREMKPFAETGSITFSQANPFQWQTVTLNNTFSDPIVVAQPPSFNGTDPATVRIRNVQSDSFQIQVDEWDYLDGGHGSETISYVVIERGTHVLDNGRSIHAGTAQINHNFKTVLTPNTVFTAIPVVISQSQTVVGGSAIITRTDDNQINSREIRLQEEQLSDGTHSFETVGFIAAQFGNANTGGSKMSVSGFNINNDFRTVNFTQEFDDAPIFIGGIQTYNGGDTVSSRYRNLTADNVEVRLQEENSADIEERHNDEYFTFLAIEEGTFYALTNGGHVGGTTIPVPPPEEMPTGNSDDTTSDFNDMAFAMSVASSNHRLNNSPSLRTDLANDDDAASASQRIGDQTGGRLDELHTRTNVSRGNDAINTDLISDLSWLVYRDLDDQTSAQ